MSFFARIAVGLLVLSWVLIGSQAGRVVFGLLVLMPLWVPMLACWMSAVADSAAFPCANPPDHAPGSDA